MVTEIRLYFEGDRRLKPGFDAFFSGIHERARQKRCVFRTIATGGNPDRDFRIALRDHPDAWNVLLKDSEGPDWRTCSVVLCQENGWDEGSVFWMVEMMEAWFHADKAALEKFYGEGFNRNALKPNPEVERIPKKDLLDRLNHATRNTLKGCYDKTAHAPKLLERIHPELVRKASPNCERLFQAVLSRFED